MTLKFLICATWGIIHRAGKSWTWCRSVGGAVGGDLKLTVSHSSKGVKKQLDT